MARITYIPNRVIDTDGIADGASIHVYQAGTTTPISIYADADCTVPLSNPYVVAAGAAVPPIYHNYNGEIRLRVVSDSGSVTDDDPYSTYVLDTDLASYTIRKIGTRSAMAALTNPIANQARYLQENGREGIFLFDDSDLSTYVAADTLQGVYVAPDSDTTGASGAWVRQFDRLKPRMFGASSGTRTGDRTFDITGKTDQAPALEALFTLAAAMSPTPEIDLRGVWALGSNLEINLPQQCNTVIYGGAFRVMDGITLDDAVTITNLGRSTVVGEFYVSGNGGSTYANRLVTHGVRVQNATRARIDYLRVDHVKRNSVDMPSTSDNIALHIGTLKGIYCGSARPGQTGAQTGLAFTARSDTGSTGSTGQRSVLTVGAGNVPSEWTQFDIVRINGRPYSIMATDNVAGTVTVYPWIDPISLTSGTINSCHGGIISMDGGDVSSITIDQVDAHNSGCVVWPRGNWGPTINNIVAQHCGVVLMLSENPSSACQGTVINGLHSEGNEFDIIDQASSTRGLFLSGVRTMGSSGDAFSKCYRLTPMFSGGTRQTESFPGSTINMDGIDYNSIPLGQSYGGSGSSTTVDNTAPNRVLTISGQNNPTLTLAWKDGAARVIGNMHWCSVNFQGSGTNHQPTGTVTVQGGTVVVSTTSDGRTPVIPASVLNLLPGMQVTGTGVPANTTVSSVNKLAGTVVLNNAVPAATNDLTYQYNVSIDGVTGTSKTFTSLKAPLQLRAVMNTATGTWRLTAYEERIYPTFTSTDSGLAPASGGGTTNFLRADGTWTTPAPYWTETTLASDFTENTATFTTITDGTDSFSYTPPANSYFEIHAMLLVQTTSSTVTPRIGVNVQEQGVGAYGAVFIHGTGTSNSTSTQWSGNFSTTATDIQQAGTSLPSGNIPYIMEVKVRGKTGAAPAAINIQMAAETAGTTCTVREGSQMRTKAS